MPTLGWCNSAETMKVGTLLADNPTALRADGKGDDDDDDNFMPTGKAWRSVSGDEGVALPTTHTLSPLTTKRPG